MKFDDFLKITLIKIINVYLIPIIIGAIFSSLGSWNIEGDKYFGVKLFSIVLLSIWYVITSFRYYKIDEKLQLQLEENKKDIKKLEQKNGYLVLENKAFNKTLLSLTSLFNNYADSINNIANTMLLGQAKLDNWNYQTVCVGICNGVYETICLRSGYDDFSVSVMLYDINARGKSKNIRMIAQKGKYEGHPSIFDTPLNMNKYKDFYAVKMFRRNSPDISIFTSNDDINKNFVFSDNGKEHPNYSQYVGIPIQCSGKQMISLLQICAFNDSKIANTKDEIASIINSYVLPFTYFALLNNKMEKGFVNSITMLEKERVSCQ